MRRIAKNADSTVRHFYYSNSWQVIEERIDTSSDADLLVRDRDASDPANGTMDERLYALQDANWNVTSLVDTSGGAVERDLYDACGSSTVLDAAATIHDR